LFSGKAVHKVQSTPSEIQDKTNTRTTELHITPKLKSYSLPLYRTRSYISRTPMKKFMLDLTIYFI